MGNLDGPAKTALRLAEFLTTFDATLGRLKAPLRSLQVLLSPSPNEAALPVPAGILPATSVNIRGAARQWRKDATTDNGNVTLFYFAGHEIQRLPAEGVLLPQDILEGYPESGAPILDRAFDVNNLYNGMAPMPIAGGASETIARTQYYFLDACRAPLQALAQFANAAPPQLFNVRADGIDERDATRFFAAAAGSVGYALPGGTTFGEDVLTCLKGAAAELLPNAGWVVTVDRMSRALEVLKNQWNSSRPPQFRRTFEVGNITAPSSTLLSLRAAPSVPCHFTIVPDTARTNSRIRVVALRAGAEQTVHTADGPFPPTHDVDLPGGQYIVRGCNAAGGPACACNQGTGPVCTIKTEDLAFILPPVFEHDVVFP